MRGALRRLAIAAATLALVSALVFVVMDALADRAALDLGRGASPEALAARRTLLGLDRPWIVRLFEHVSSAMSLDLGVSARRGVGVAEVLRAALGPTLAYALPGLLMASIVAVLAGLRAARSGGWFDRLVLAGSTVLMSTSGVIVVVLGQYWLAHRLRLFPVLGWPLGGDARGVAWFVVLPALLWAVIQVGADLRHYRAVFVRELAAPHLEGLRARGVDERRISRHVLRGAAAPLLARISARLPHVVLGGVVVEHVFNIPGVGALLVAAIRDADLPVVQGIAFVLAAATIAGQVVCDALAAWVDPRVRDRWEAGR